MTSYYFYLNDRVVPKARPRFNGSYAYTPAPYKSWKENAIAIFTKQKQAQEILQPIEHLSVAIRYQGSYRGDRDNIEGSILDALTQAKVIAGDNLKRNPIGNFIFIPSKKFDICIELIANPAIPLFYKLLEYKSVKKRQDIWQKIIDLTNYQTVSQDKLIKNNFYSQTRRKIDLGIEYDRTSKIISQLNLDFQSSNYKINFQQNYYLKDRQVYSSEIYTDLSSIIYDL